MTSGNSESTGSGEDGVVGVHGPSQSVEHAHEHQLNISGGGRRRWMYGLAGLNIVVLVALGMIVLGFNPMSSAPKVDISQDSAVEAGNVIREHQRGLELAECETVIGDYVDALVELDTGLDIGMTLADYTSQVRELASTKNDVETSGLSETCESVLEDADTAYDLYAAAVSEWDDCVWDYGCDTDTDIDLSGDFWIPASMKVDSATHELDGAVEGRTV